jgi:hypothetical protein
MAADAARHQDRREQMDTQAHRDRCPRTGEELSLFASLYDQPGTPLEEARLPALHGQPLVRCSGELPKAPKRLATWKGSTFQQSCLTRPTPERRHHPPGDPFPTPRRSWILSGLTSSWQSLLQDPKKICDRKQPLRCYRPGGTPRGLPAPDEYIPACSREEYVRRTPSVPWDGRKVTEFFRYINREMTGPSAERTLIPSIIPPKVAYINTCFGVVFKNKEDMLVFYLVHFQSYSIFWQKLQERVMQT